MYVNRLASWSGPYGVKGPRGSDVPRGFTLLELLVVLAIFGVLMGLLLSAVQQVRMAALRTQCANNLRQMGLALTHYHDVNKVLPPGMSYEDGESRYLYMTWHTRLLPFIEQQVLWTRALEAYAIENDPFDNPPHTNRDTVVPLYGCPADSRVFRPALVRGHYSVALTSYLGVEGLNEFRRDGVLYVDSHTRLGDITDGLSNTLLVGERPASADEDWGWWYVGNGQNLDGAINGTLGVQERNLIEIGCPLGPYAYGPGRLSNQCDVFHFWSLHLGGANFLFADGSLHFLSYSAAGVMPALASRAGGEAVASVD